jgi:predicted enzyme related to lactoylglutathione lyase
MAVIADPTGAALCAWEPRANIGAGRVNEPGCLTWNELGTNDVREAARFYAELFGWTYDERDFGGEEPYRVIMNADRANGGIRSLTEAEAGMPPNWLVYLATEEAGAAAGRVGELGGKVLVPPFEVPMGARIAVVADPQGAVFALYAGTLDD